MTTTLFRCEILTMALSRPRDDLCMYMDKTYPPYKRTHDVGQLQPTASHTVTNRNIVCSKGEESTSSSYHHEISNLINRSIGDSNFCISVALIHGPSADPTGVGIRKETSQLQKTFSVPFCDAIHDRAKASKGNRQEYLD
jgi:hypothetical protein